MKEKRFRRPRNEWCRWRHCVHDLNCTHPKNYWKHCKEKLLDPKKCDLFELTEPYDPNKPRIAR